MIAYLNDKSYQIIDGETVLQFAKRNLIQIPTLCDLPQLESFGSCRVCSVEIAFSKDGNRKTMASCHTPVSEGMYIYTHSANINKLRKNIIELVLTDHPLECLTCEVNNNCELQSVAASVGITEVRYPQGDNHKHYQKDLSHPYMTSDLSKCINCYRCVRACDEIQGQFVLNMAGRGFDNHIIKSNDVSFMDSDCVSCGACAQACPTSAISDVFMSKSVQSTEKTRTICTYCGVGCNLEVATKDNQILSIQASSDAEVNQGHTCLKGRYAFGFYNHPERLQSPMVRQNGELVECSWDEAYDFIQEKLTKLISEFGKNTIAGISSARCTNEENYLMQKFMRTVVGNNNIDCCARVCHSPTALGMQNTFGTGAATNSIEDIKHTDCILVIGANPTESHPVTGAKLKQFAMKSGTTIVIDPRKTELASYATYHLAPRPGTNVAVLNMMFYYIIKNNLVDQNFINTRTEGFEDFKNSVMQLNMDELQNITGVDKNLVEQAAIAYASAANAMSFHGLGVTEHSQGTKAVMQIAELAMITGNIGRKGVGVNPLRGQNNVQGAADMGAQPHQGAGYLSAYDTDIQQIYSQHYGVQTPIESGYKIPEMFDAAISGKLKSMWIIGEDVVQTDPNTQKVIKALKNLDLLIVQELFMTETCKLADVVLPASSFLEKNGTFTNGERRVQAVHQAVQPLAGTKPDGQIIIDIMNRMGMKQKDYHPDWVLDEISKIVPFFAGISWEKLGKNGMQWPVDLSGKQSPLIHETEFKRGLGHFEFHDFHESNEIIQHQKEFPYILTTNRKLQHYNCGAMTRRTKNVELLTEDVILINPKDAQTKSINDGDLVCVSSARGKIDIKAQISDEVKPGILSTTFHFPEIMVNNITSDEHDADAKCPEYKVVAVNFRKSKGKHKQLAQSVS
ncbi:MAG TPA: formate dehydrogenase subunit alpha [Gammaproteobacteria bacterium]|nr:formate dehydrogenase subunit alpha [Xanthomonadales bacterium]MCB1593424.1 formate dehydrogenase subunit alpha [Xanthomonadales bacterium]HOP21823.1 formate dehydrogenase subunit alpha [Gammaproteobacteria bacterium]HPI96010.1 formate dehydrogenase subunit alpha [Gammaproteobacteria bacterium]HPQ87521.1 formate dehydrogenase subunit alpha [Gammaproteobacteria bacterium]